MLGATSESFADALERFCASPPKHLLQTQEGAAAAADLAATLSSLQKVHSTAATDGGSSSSKKIKKQQQLANDLVRHLLVVAESSIAQVDSQGVLATLLTHPHLQSCFFVRK